MKPRNSGLGRGLDALLPDGDEAVTEVAIDSVQPAPDQPRQRFPERELMELAHSIRQHGLLQPLVVAPAAGGSHRLIAGERRLRAAKLAGLAHVPVVIRDSETQSHFELALIENLQRADLSPVEEARAYVRLLEAGAETQDSLAKRLGKSRARIAHMIRLLKLTPAMQAALERGEISVGHAQALLGHDPVTAERLFRTILAKRLTVRQAEAWRPGRRPTAPATETPDWLRQLELELGLPITRRGSNDRGTLSIRYDSGEQLERIVRRLAGKD